jgi:DNA polymerase theta
MSATLPNLNILATWLHADLYFTSYRPVPLTETFKIGPVIYGRSDNVVRELSKSRMVVGDGDHVLLLCQETVEEGNGVLVFCPTKSWCEKLAESIAKHFYTLGSAKTKEASSLSFDYDALKEVFEQLRSCQVGIDNMLARTLRYGVAYHHAGLTYDERDIIEAGFKQSTIKVLVATSTLSSGNVFVLALVWIHSPCREC